MTDRLQWTLDNIYTIARREAGKDDPRGRWGHVVRLCEEAGCQPRGVLRDNGGSIEPERCPPNCECLSCVVEKYPPRKGPSVERERGSR